jgi:hypothetical protein
VDNVYSFAPGAEARIQYSRYYEGLRGGPNAMLIPQDPEGWQMFVKRLQARANALRREQKDVNEDVGTWPLRGNSEGGREED